MTQWTLISLIMAFAIIASVDLAAWPDAQPAAKARRSRGSLGAIDKDEDENLEEGMEEGTEGRDRKSDALHTFAPHANAAAPKQAAKIDAGDGAGANDGVAEMTRHFSRAVIPAGSSGGYAAKGASSPTSLGSPSPLSSVAGSEVGRLLLEQEVERRRRVGEIAGEDNDKDAEKHDEKDGNKDDTANPSGVEKAQLEAPLKR